MIESGQTNSIKHFGELSVSLLPLINPYDQNSKTEAWGRILLIYTENEVREILLDWQWDINVLKEWLDARKIYLLTEDFPYKGLGDISIAEGNRILYNRALFESDKEQNEYYEDLASYFENHYFIIRGTPTPRYYFGMNKGVGEISRYDDSDILFVRYFDMPMFIRQTELELESFYKNPMSEH
jgi:hypothetical protein